MTWHDMTWHDMTWHDMISHDMTFRDVTWHNMTVRDVTCSDGEVVLSSLNLPPAMVMSPRLNVLAKINSEGNSATQPRPHSPLLQLLEKDIQDSCLLTVNSRETGRVVLQWTKCNLAELTVVLDIGLQRENIELADWTVLIMILHGEVQSVEVCRCQESCNGPVS